MSPFSGDNNLYKGVIRNFKRSPGGDVLAVVKFDGYSEDDIEEVKVDLLEKVKANVKVNGKYLYIEFHKYFLVFRIS